MQNTLLQAFLRIYTSHQAPHMTCIYYNKTDIYNSLGENTTTDHEVKHHFRIEKYTCFNTVIVDFTSAFGIVNIQH